MKYKFNLIGRITFVCMLLFSSGMVTTAKEKIVQQPVKVTGLVKDNNNEPLPGVTILVQGTTRGVTTDLDGSYSIEVKPTDKLSFSYIGFETQVMEVGDQTAIDVILLEKHSALEEVTIVGYGSQRKESVIGAITSVSVRELRMPVGKVSTSLAGHLAGVIAVQRSGEPGAGADFWIRGVNTFGALNRPLILVDGIERPLDLVDTEDIETFSVLKDATATAVYGVRGANGVVLVTTRRGVEGKPKVTAKAEYGILAPTKMPVMANAAEFIDVYNDVYAEANNGRYYYSPEDREKYLSGVDPDLYPNVDWINEIYKKSTTSRRVNLNVTGGGQMVKYYVAGSFYNENGIFNATETEYNPEMKWTKYNFRSNLDINLTKSTVLNLNLSTQYDVKNRPRGSGDLWVNTYIVSPIAIPPIYSDGTIARTMVSGVNPYTTLNKTGYVQEFHNNAQSLIGISQDFSDFVTPGLKASAKFSWDVVNNSDITRSLNPTHYFATGRDADGNLIFHQNNTDGSNYLVFSRASSGSKTFYLEASTTYDRVFTEMHRVGGLFLFNMKETVNTIPGTYTESIPNHHMGIAARATYSFKDRYFIEGNFGYNGSENFAEKNRFGFFPSIAVGYLISNEAYWESLRETIHLLKIKASHGKIGSDQIGGGRRFAFNTEMNESAAGWTFGQTGQTARTGIATGYPGNDNVGWEESVKTNVGIEFGLFNRLKIQADYFYDFRDGIFILRRSVPSVVGVNQNPYVNLGQMENRGIDASLEYDHQVNNDWFISARANFTYNRNKVLYNDAPEPAMKYQSEIDRPLYQQFGLVYMGYFESQEDIDTSPRQEFGNVRPGDVKYRDINGDGVVNTLDQIAIGRTHVPEFNYGFGVSSMWKNLDISVFFQGVSVVTGFLDGSPLNGFEQNSAAMGGLFRDVAVNRWTEDNPDPNAKYPRLALVTSQNNKQLSTRNQANMSFMRLKNAEIGYTFPKKLTEKIKISTARIYLQGANLLTFAKFDLWDPEVNNSQGAVYPNMKIVNLGINLNF
ncbi:MAG: TonB-dependent receptor [Bacteroidales bacterium]|jgi:TonB-linked SusC/RagA family outer membrane protein|nr:TonB-dependent receptor [Bacteroidales bacterium]